MCSFARYLGQSSATYPFCVHSVPRQFAMILSVRAASFLHRQHFARDLTAQPFMLQCSKWELHMQTWRQIYCDIHGRDHLIWLNSADTAETPFTVICTKCAERKIADASYELAEQYADKVSGMVIVGASRQLPNQHSTVL